MIVVVEVGAYERLEPGMNEVYVSLEVSVEDSQGYSLCSDVHRVSVFFNDETLSYHVCWGSSISPIRWLEKHIITSALEGSDIRVEGSVHG